jgi:hypothetical protein
MNLFSRDKDIIFKIVNGVFLIWFIAAVILTANSIIEYVVREPIPSYQEFRVTEFKNFPEEKGNEMTDAEVRKMYDQSYSGRDSWALRFMFTSMANVVIVGGAILVINRTPNKKITKPEE